MEFEPVGLIRTTLRLVLIEGRQPPAQLVATDQEAIAVVHEDACERLDGGVAGVDSSADGFDRWIARVVFPGPPLESFIIPQLGSICLGCGSVFLEMGGL